MKPVKGFSQEPLRALATFVSGGTPSKRVSDYWGKHTLWVSAKDLKSFWIQSSVEMLSESGRSVASLVPAGTVLILVRGMGLFKDIPLGIASVDLAINQDLKGLKPKSSVDAEYLAYALLAKKHELMQMVEAAGHGTGRLDTDRLKDLVLPCPRMSIQKQIVSVLKAWDTGIERSEQLMVVKRKRYKWFMQQLLAGKRRVSDLGTPAKDHSLPSDWKDMRLTALFKPVKRKNTKAQTRVLTASGEHGLVDQSKYFDRSVAGESLDSYFLVRRGEFAYNRSSMNGYPYGATKRLDSCEEGVLSTLCICFKIASDECDSDYYKHLFEGRYIDSQLRRIAQVGARAHGLLNVTQSDFFSLIVPCPPIEEQRKIATLIDDAVTELDLLRAQLDALKRQKRGLMQKLLTGEWPVRIDEPEMSPDTESNRGDI
jgi:type I restriction enzyme, S subunit